MKIVVTHNSPDWDAITSVWLLKRYLPGWENAVVNFVPAGTRSVIPSEPIRQTQGRLRESRDPNTIKKEPIEKIANDEIIHVDTGLGPLDHHQTSDLNVCAASLTYEYVKQHSVILRLQPKNPLRTEQEILRSAQNDKREDKLNVKLEALQRIVKYVVALDHFQEVFWPDAAENYQEFGFFGILEGYKTQYPNQDTKYMEFGLVLLDAMLHRMEEVIWAEREIKEKGKQFNTRFGKGIGIETLNDDTIKLAQKRGYAIVVRKDPRKGYVRIKCLPERASNLQKTQNTQSTGRSDNQTDRQSEFLNIRNSGSLSFPNVPKTNIDLTLIKEQLSKMDPKATWFLHVSKKMLLNGTPKNPKMIPTTLSLQEIIEVVKRI